MVDVKLGNLTFEGCDSVKLNTTDGGEVVFTLEGSGGGEADHGKLIHGWTGGDVGGIQPRTPIPLIEGKEYTVVCDAGTFTAVCKKARFGSPEITAFWIGNGFCADASLPDTGEPFVYYEDDTEYYMSECASETFLIYDGELDMSKI